MTGAFWFERKFQAREKRESRGVARQYVRTTLQRVNESRHIGLLNGPIGPIGFSFLIRKRGNLPKGSHNNTCARHYRVNESRHIGLFNGPIGPIGMLLFSDSVHCGWITVSGEWHRVEKTYFHSPRFPRTCRLHPIRCQEKRIFLHICSHDIT